MYERIRDLREDHDLKQEDIARLLHCTQACYSNYETGKRDIPTEVLHTLADYYHVSIDYLLGHKSPVTDDERQLLAQFRSFTPSQRRLLLEQAELLTHYKIKLDD